MDRRVRDAVLERLGAIETMAARAGATLSAPLARRHIQSFTGGWRELLTAHQRDPTGRCAVCVGWLRRRRWPCKVWVDAYRYLIGDGTALIERTSKNSNPFCQPRHVQVIPRQLDASAVDQAATSNASRPAPRSETGNASIYRA